MCKRSSSSAEPPVPSDQNGSGLSWIYRFGSFFQYPNFRLLSKVRSVWVPQNEVGYCFYTSPATLRLESGAVGVGAKSQKKSMYRTAYVEHPKYDPGKTLLRATPQTTTTAGLVAVCEETFCLASLFFGESFFCEALSI